MVNDITEGVANMMSDMQATPEAINFLQTLSSSVTKNQEQLNQVTSSINNLQNQVQQAMNAATNNNRNTYQPPPQQFPNPPFQPTFCPLIPQQFQQPYEQYPQQNPEQGRNNNNRWGNRNNNCQQGGYNQGYYDQGQQQQGYMQYQPVWYQQAMTRKQQNNTGQRRQRTPNNGMNHYCWTCGAGNHPSAQCKNPAPGHQWGATFRQRFGGNQNGCWD